MKASKGGCRASFIAGLLAAALTLSCGSATPEAGSPEFAKEADEEAAEAEEGAWPEAEAEGGAACTVEEEAGEESAAEEGAAEGSDVTGGQSPEVPIFDSNTPRPEPCGSAQEVLARLSEKWTEIGCSKQNGGGARRERYECRNGQLTLVRREHASGPGFTVALQWAGNMAMDIKAVARNSAGLKECGVGLPEHYPEGAAPMTLYGYSSSRTCWNNADCPTYCRDAVRFLRRAKERAVERACSISDNGSLVGFECERPSDNGACAHHLEGVVRRYYSDPSERDALGARAFSITYGGNSIKSCRNEPFPPGESSGFGEGFPDFLTELRDLCHP